MGQGCRVSLLLGSVGRLSWLSWLDGIGLGPRRVGLGHRLIGLGHHWVGLLDGIGCRGHIDLLRLRVLVALLLLLLDQIGRLLVQLLCSEPRIVRLLLLLEVLQLLLLVLQLLLLVLQLLLLGPLGRLCRPIGCVLKE